MTPQQPTTLWPNPTDLESLYDSQIRILPHTFRTRVGILAGTPGTGKSFVTAEIIKYLARTYGGHTIAVAAPTGKAANRITNLMSKNGLSIVATTIHRLLEVGRNGHDGEGWGFQRNKARPLSQMFYFIDETSMLGAKLCDALFEAIPAGAHVLLIGDPYQLPPIEHGAPLRDMIAYIGNKSQSSRIGYGELTEVQRNAGDIVRGCRLIKDGQWFQPHTAGLDLTSGKNWLHSESRSAHSQISRLERLLHSVPKSFSRIDDIQIICALNGKSESDKNPISRMNLNTYLQQLLNPENPIEKNRKFALNDKVICTGNGLLEVCHIYPDGRGSTEIHATGIHEPVSNGQIGRVIVMEEKRAVVELSHPKRTVIVPLVGASDGTKAKFELGYAVTCHKMQGSQSPVLVSMIDDSGGANYVTSREWHYTAVSRAETICVTIGKWETLMQQCRIQSLGKRKTFLVDRLEGLNNQESQTSGKLVGATAC